MQQVRNQRGAVDPFKLATMLMGALVLIFLGIIIFYEPSGDQWETDLAALNDQETFFVYVYSSDCPACIVIADEVNNFDAIEPMGIELERVSFDQGGAAHNIPFPSEYMVTPTIHVVHQGRVVRTEIDIDPILDLFNEVFNNTFTPTP